MAQDMLYINRLDRASLAYAPGICYYRLERYEINGLLDLDAFTDSIKTELRFVKRLEEVAETFAQE